MSYKIGSDRFNHLQALMREFRSTKSDEAKEQIIVNLGNFSYDPRNFDYLYRLDVIDLFLDNLDNEKFKEHAIGGLCNLASDERNRNYIINHDGLQHAVKCLASENEEVIISCITFIITMATGLYCTEKIFTPKLIEDVKNHANSTNRRITNLVSLFTSTYCSRQKIENRRSLH